MAKLWTKTEIKRLKRLVNERKTNKEIGRILGRTQRAIEAKKVKHGIYKPIPLSPNNPLHLAEVIKFKMAGWTLTKIAKIYGCTPQHVSRVLTFNGMVGFIRNPANPQHPYAFWTEYEVHRLRKYCKKGYGLDRICTYFPRRSRESVEIRIRNMTRYWQSPEERAIRKHYRDKWMKMRVY